MFIGTKNPSIAKGLLKAVKSVMFLFEVTDREKVKYISYFLKEDTRVSWDLTLKTINITYETWANFRKFFMVEYKTTYVNYL